MNNEKNMGDTAEDSGPRSPLQSPEDGRISAAIAIAPAHDLEYEEAKITNVHAYNGGGWDIKREDGWSFVVPAGSPVEPKEGMTARFYGKGIGFEVRGLVIDGVCVFYRSKEEQREYSDAQLYGKDASDWVARWDEGKSIFSISMGGLGPGYEQCIQVLAVEVVRHLLKEGANWWDGSSEESDAKWKDVRKGCDAVVSELDQHFGFSGAQVGQAISLAAHIYRKGPIVVMNEDAVKDRHIQVSRGFPTWPIAKATRA